jgi:hypothetical protein
LVEDVASTDGDPLVYYRRTFTRLDAPTLARSGR